MGVEYPDEHTFMKKKRSLFSLLLEVMAVLGCALFLGAGIGFFKGVVVAMVWNDSSTEYVLFIGEQGAIVGAACSLLVFPFVYYFAMRNRLSLAKALELIMVVGLIGVASAMGMSQ